MSGGLQVVWDPAIDAGAWPGALGSRRAIVGEVWLGPLGLLGLLESELGLGGLHASPLDRAGHLAAKLASRDGWWRASYDADPIGTCQRLLRDRDLLVHWGWRGEAAGERLGSLWAATADALPGLPDRLGHVEMALVHNRVDIDSITATSAIASQSPSWIRLFVQLASSGVAISESVPATAVSTGDLARARTSRFAPSGDGSLTLLRPHGPLAAADEIAATLAALPSLDGVLVVGGDDVLDAALGRHGLPRLGAPLPAPASASLIRLVVEAAFEPMEPLDLHALLCLDPGPVPLCVAWLLVNALRELPSRRSTVWQKALADGLALCDDSRRADARARLDALLVPAVGRDGAIAAAEISRRLEIVAAWARAGVSVSPSLRIVARLADEACILLDAHGAAMLSLVALRRLCDELDGSHGLAVRREVGIGSVPDPGAVLAPARIIVWWGFTRDSAPMAPRLRLSSRERESLSQLGVTPPDFGRLMEGEAARWRRPLDMAAEALVLVSPATSDGGEPSFPHPLWDELRAAMPRAEDAALLETDRLRFPAAPRRTAVAARALPSPTPSVRTGVAIAPRERESPSSLERLLGCSMAWALHYNGKLRPGRSAGPGAPSPLLYGQLAHHLLARVFADGGLGADAAAERAQMLVDSELGGLCESLALARHQLERTVVKQAIVRAARELGALIAATGATVRGVELQAEGALAGATAFGRLDLVLSNPDVIVDLKWGRASYRDLLVAGAALQLAAYAELLSTGDARHEVVYFTLQTQELFGQVGSALPGVQIHGTTTARDTWTGALSAIAERRSELAEGVLFAPGADGTQIKSRLDGNRLVIAPACDYCGFTVLCGQSTCK